MKRAYALGWQTSPRTGSLHGPGANFALTDRSSLRPKRRRDAARPRTASASRAPGLATQTRTKTRRLATTDRPDRAPVATPNKTTYLRGAKRPVRRTFSGLTCLRPHEAASRWATQTQTKTGAPGSRPSNDAKASHMALSPSAGLLHGGMTDVCAFAPLRLYVRDDCRSPMQNLVAKGGLEPPTRIMIPPLYRLSYFANSPTRCTRSSFVQTPRLRTYGLRLVVRRWERVGYPRIGEQRRCPLSLGCDTYPQNSI